jgi:ubiquitin C-terminal hydrolase
MLINEKIFTKIFLGNFVNEKTFKLMNLNEKISFEEVKYIFKEKMIIFFLEKYSTIKILLSLAGSPSKIINITFAIFYVDTYNYLSKKFEEQSSEEIINYLKEINIFSVIKYAFDDFNVGDVTFIAFYEEKIIEALLNCNAEIDKNNNKINFTYVKLVSFRGLENVGATCYMNATLQCLANLKLITNNLLNEDIYNFLIKNKDICRMTYEYTKVLIGLFCDESRTGYFCPMDFKKTISEFNPLFQGIQANDSKDLIIFLLEILNKELVKIYNRRHKIIEDIQNEDAYQNIDTSNEKMVLILLVLKYSIYKVIIPNMPRFEQINI